MPATCGARSGRSTHCSAPGSGTAYDGYVHFDYKPPRTEDLDGVWATAAACMRNYLILRDKVQAFRADPEVIAALDDVAGRRTRGPDPRRR